MEKYSLLSRIGALYKDGVNIIDYLKNLDNRKETCLQDIMISYDFQAGSYNEYYINHKEERDRYIEPLAELINNLPGRNRTIFEAGVGEGTTLVPLLNSLNVSFASAGGVDVSWSRIKEGRNFQKKYLKRNIDLSMVVGDMFNLPLADNSIDVVYTNHAVEPNGGHEREIIQELYRVAREYLILLEPAYELAGLEAKERMERNGYVKEIYKVSQDMRMNIIRWELYPYNTNPLNPTGILIIKKNPCKEYDNYENIIYCDPVTHTELELWEDVYFTPKGLLSYPIVRGVPCLMKENAIVTTQMTRLI